MDLQTYLQIFTIEGWVYHTSLYNYITWASTTRGATGFNIGTDASGIVVWYSSGGRQIQSTSGAVKTNCWQHFAYVRNGTTITAYLDGISVGSATISTNFSATALSIGGLDNTSEYFTGYLSDIRIYSAAKYTSNFTPVNPTNSFYLQFADNSSNTAATLGKDTSGNSNNWTPNNLSVTAGAGNDSLVDTPTSYGTDTGVGGSVRGNYCTWNPLASASTSTLSNGNLDAMTGTTYPGTVSATFGMSTGKWYWEITFSGSNYGPYIGIKSTAEATTSYPGQAATSYSWYSEGSSYSKKINNSISVDYSLGVGFTLGDIIGVAFDVRCRIT